MKLSGPLEVVESALPKIAWAHSSGPISHASYAVFG